MSDLREHFACRVKQAHPHHLQLDAAVARIGILHIGVGLQAQLGKNGGHFDMEQGLRHLEAAAERGHLGAMHFLGLIHFKGVNVPVDPVKARKWIAMGAERDEPAELYNLGMLDWTGAGLAKPDRASAMNHWRRAAKLGNENARKALKTGRPVE